MSALWTRLGIDPVINAAGKMTYLGSSRLHDEVVAAMAEAADCYVRMGPLADAAGARAAELLGAPAARIVASAAAGLAMSVAACVAGTDLPLAESLPLGAPARSDVVLAAGHAVNFGAPLTTMIGIGGGKPCLVGSANRVAVDHYAWAMGPNVAAVLYVVSHHSGEGAPPLSDVVAVAHRAGVPVIVDAAAEVDLRPYLATGADLVVTSGHKAMGGPTSGVVLGSPALIAAVATQEKGVGRAMKVPKETLAGIIVAIERYVAGESSPSIEQLDARLDKVRAGLRPEYASLAARVVDGTRPISRLRITVPPDCAARLVELLESGTPAVLTRNHKVASGAIDVDPRELDDAQAERLGLLLDATLERALA
jgi:D-glucosaminate-6-phosphate ammonia-lyase